MLGLPQAGTVGVKSLAMQKISGDIGLVGYSEAIGTVEIVQIWTTGQSEPPTLNMRAEIKLRPLIDRSQPEPTFRPVTLLRAIGEFKSPEYRVVARFQDDILLFAQEKHFETKAQINFEIPMDVSTIHRIEEERNGTNLRVGLRLRFTLAFHGKDGLTFHAGGVNDLVFTIPRSQWVDELLPGLRYGGLEILEVRYGSGMAAEGLRKSVAEIKEAKKYLAEGQWDKSALHCRMSIEEILISKSNTSSQTNNRFEQKVNDFLADNLPGLDDAEAKFLSGQMNLLWHITSTALHGGPQHTFKRPDAEFVVRITMAAVEYFSRTLR